MVQELHNDQWLDPRSDRVKKKEKKKLHTKKSMVKCVEVKQTTETSEP